ncbi:actin-3-like [Aethina tumida]|uniref:actin-3-like n=1 Tax=Aethina tumida TaxID=116153 RepID=UPI002147D807|nr:actin-3-like [Aethina tumida]
MSFFKRKPVIIDAGSGYCRAGYADEDNPEVTLRRDKVSTYESNEHRLAINWDETESLFQTMYEYMGIRSEHHAVLLTEPPLESNQNRERMAELFFEKFGVPGLSMAMDAILAIYGSGRTNGLVLDVGHYYTKTVAFCDGSDIKRSICKSALGGFDLTQYLSRIMTEVGYYCRTHADIEALHTMKEKVGYVALDFQEELSKPLSHLEAVYKLPDGVKLTVSDQRFRCSEPLFEPILVGSGSLSVSQMVYKSIMACSETYQKELFNNIVLIGGSTLFPGFVARLHEEMKRQYSRELGIIASKSRSEMAWAGGSVISTLSSFRRMWISNEDYQEYGPSIINSRHWT